MNVVARVAAVLYGMPPPEVRKLLRRGDWAKLASDGTDDFAEELIRGFIRHAVSKLRAAGISVHTVVVLADEVARAEEAFSDEYNLRSAAKRDVTSVLRKSVLDKPILDINATLVISSLTLSPPLA
jgi:hypothetical protein